MKSYVQNLPVRQKAGSGFRTMRRWGGARLSTRQGNLILCIGVKGAHVQASVENNSSQSSGYRCSLVSNLVWFVEETSPLVVITDPVKIVTAVEASLLRLRLIPSKIINNAGVDICRSISWQLYITIISRMKTVIWRICRKSFSNTVNPWAHTTS